MPYMEAMLITLAAGAASSSGGGQPAQVQHADQVDLDHPAQFFQGLLLDGAVVADPGVVDQHVEAAAGGQPPGQRLPVGRVGDVAGHHLDPLAALAGQLVKEIGAAGGGQHVRARLMQHPREPRAQAR